MFIINDKLQTGRPTPEQTQLLTAFDSDHPIVLCTVARRIGTSVALNNYVSKKILEGYRICIANTSLSKKVSSERTYAEMMYGSFSTVYKIRPMDFADIKGCMFDLLVMDYSPSFPELDSLLHATKKAIIINEQNPKYLSLIRSRYCYSVRIGRRDYSDDYDSRNFAKAFQTPKFGTDKREYGLWCPPNFI